MTIDDAVKLYNQPDYMKASGTKTLCAYYDKTSDTRSVLFILYNNADKKIIKLKLITSVRAELKDIFPRLVDNELGAVCKLK